MILMEQERTSTLKVPKCFHFKDLTDDVYVGEWILKSIMSQIAGHDCALSQAIQNSHVRVETMGWSKCFPCCVKSWKDFWCGLSRLVGGNG